MENTVVSFNSAAIKFDSTCVLKITGINHFERTQFSVWPCKYMYKLIFKQIKRSSQPLESYFIQPKSFQFSSSKLLSLSHGN